MSFLLPLPNLTSFLSKIIIHLIFLTVFMVTNLHAGNVTITWDANTESDLAGYKIYQRILPSLDYGLPIYNGFPQNPASPLITISNILEGRTYGFIVTAYDTSGNESPPSPEILFTVTSDYLEDDDLRERTFHSD